MKALEKEDLRKEFFNLIRQQNISIEEAIDKLYNKDDYLIIETNNVYVYMGTYKLEHPFNPSWYPVEEVFVSEEDKTAEYKLFYELDTGLSRAFNIGDDLDRFEQNNIIINMPNLWSIERNRYTLEEDFKKLRKSYLKELCIRKEEIAFKLITSEEYIKKVFSIKNFIKERNLSPVFYKVISDTAMCNKDNDSKSIVLKKSIKK